MGEEKVVKTGTTTVCVVCKDGIVMAADKRATAGYISNKKMKKIVRITDNIAITTAGVVSDIQLLSKLIKAELKLKDIQTNRVSNVKEAANLLAGMVYANFRRFTTFLSVTGFLVAGKDEEGCHLYELGIDGSVLDIDDYASDGSGNVFALGVLETLYKKGITIDEGIKLVVRAVNAAIQRDPNSGNGLDVVTITDKGVQWVIDKELNNKLEI